MSTKQIVLTALRWTCRTLGVIIYTVSALLGGFIAGVLYGAFVKTLTFDIYPCFAIFAGVLAGIVAGIPCLVLFGLLRWLKPVTEWTLFYILVAIVGGILVVWGRYGAELSGNAEAMSVVSKDFTGAVPGFIAVFIKVVNAVVCFVFSFCALVVAGMFSVVRDDEQDPWKPREPADSVL